MQMVCCCTGTMSGGMGWATDGPPGCAQEGPVTQAIAPFGVCHACIVAVAHTGLPHLLVYLAQPYRAGRQCQRTVLVCSLLLLCASLALCSKADCAPWGHLALVGSLCNGLCELFVSSLRNCFLLEACFTSLPLRQHPCQHGLMWCTWFFLACPCGPVKTGVQSSSWSACVTNPC